MWRPVAAIVTVALVVGAALAPQRSAEPSAVARDFVQTLITAPAAPERTTVPAHHLPQALFERFSTHVTFDYLRARYQQGARLRFVAQEARQAAPHRWIVTVLISALDESGTPTHEARFAISLMQEANGALRVEGVSEVP